MGSLFFSSRTEISTGKRGFLKGSPKFPTGISEPKMCIPFPIFTSSKPYSNFDACHVLFSRVVQMVHANPERNFSLGIFAYHLYRRPTGFPM